MVTTVPAVNTARGLNVTRHGTIQALEPGNQDHPRQLPIQHTMCRGICISYEYDSGRPGAKEPGSGQGGDNCMNATATWVLLVLLWSKTRFLAD